MSNCKQTIKQAIFQKWHIDASNFLPQHHIVVGTDKTRLTECTISNINDKWYNEQGRLHEQTKG